MEKQRNSVKPIPVVFIIDHPKPFDHFKKLTDARQAEITQFFASISREIGTNFVFRSYSNDRKDLGKKRQKLFENSVLCGSIAFAPKPTDQNPFFWDQKAIIVLQTIVIAKFFCPRINFSKNLKIFDFNFRGRIWKSINKIQDDRVLPNLRHWKIRVAKLVVICSKILKCAEISGNILNPEPNKGQLRARVFNYLMRINIFDFNFRDWDFPKE